MADITDKELQRRIADLTKTQKRTDKEHNRRDMEIEELWRMTRAEKERTAEIDRQIAAVVETQAEVARRGIDTDRMLKDVSKQLGELGNKFGSFTEGMAWPSMQKLLKQKFKMDTVGPRVVKQHNGRVMELDVLAYANGEVNAACVVEVKSHLRVEGVKQMQRAMKDFPTFFPEHRHKRIYGILAAVDVSESVRRHVLHAGLYLARIHDDTFTLDVPDDFHAKDFGHAND